MGGTAGGGTGALNAAVEKPAKIAAVNTFNLMFMIKLPKMFDLNYTYHAIPNSSH
jgi:hypothetical protein